MNNNTSKFVDPNDTAQVKAVDLEAEKLKVELSKLIKSPGFGEYMTQLRFLDETIKDQLTKFADHEVIVYLQGKHSLIENLLSINDEIVNEEKETKDVEITTDK